MEGEASGAGFGWFTTSLLAITFVLFFILLNRKRRIQPTEGEAKTKTNNKEEEEEFEEMTEPFDPLHNNCLNNFKVITSQSGCLYAQKAKVWGCLDFKPDLTLEANVRQCIAPVIEAFVVALNKDPTLDAVVIELPPGAESPAKPGLLPDSDPSSPTPLAVKYEEFGSSVPRLADAVRRILLELSRIDPMDSQFMKWSPEVFSHWNLLFCGEAFFLTTFAPCYGKDHPRYAYGSPSAWLLLQPETSFYTHRIPVKGWPKNIRWRIRQSFARKGQAYEHNEPPEMPVAWWFVRPLDVNQEELRKKYPEYSLAPAEELVIGEEDGYEGEVDPDDVWPEEDKKGYTSVPWWKPYSEWPEGCK